MARPERNTVDYFPHLIGDGKKIFFIENKYGNDGYATWYKILEKLGATEYHFLDLNKKSEVMYLTAKCRVSEQLLLDIINDLAEMEIFNKSLWESKIIWCEKFIESIQDAYKRRNSKCMQLDSLCAHLLSNGILKPGNCDLTVHNNTQSKVKKSKEKKKKVFSPPKIDEVISYFSENGYSIEAAKKAFNYYDSADWHDAKGSPVLNWKQKMINVWFKEENKIVKQVVVSRTRGAAN